MTPYIDAFALSLVIVGLSHAAQPRHWADLPGREGVRVGIADRAGGLEEYALGHRESPQLGFSTALRSRAQGNIPAL